MFDIDDLLFVKLTNVDANDNFEVMKINDSHTTIPKGKKMVMEYIGAWQPVGKSRSKFRRVTGKIIRSSSFVRITDSWSDVPQAKRDDIWSSLMVCVNCMLGIYNI